MPKSILLAGNDQEFKEKLNKILSFFPFDIQVFSDYQEMESGLKDKHRDLIILDADLPFEAVVSTVVKIRQSAPESKVTVLFTRKPDTRDESELYRLKVAAVLKKDFSSHYMLKGVLDELILVKDLMGVSNNIISESNKIFVADDMPDVRMALVTFLRMSKFSVTGVSNGLELLEQIRITRPALVFLDLTMPGMDGFEVLHKIMEIDKTIKVVIITGMLENEPMELAKEMGAVDYITKPFDFDKLSSLVLSIFLLEKYRGQ